MDMAELIQVHCERCGRPMNIYDNHLRERMYCTIHCLEHAFESKKVSSS